MGWSALVIGVTTLAIGFAAQWGGRPAASLFLATFGGTAIWLGVMAARRYRAVRGKPGGLALLGVSLGGLAAASMLAVTTATLITDAATGGRISGYQPTITDASGRADSALPSGTARGVTGGVVPLQAEVPQPRDAPSDAQDERMQLAMVAGSAANILEALQPAGMPWPASLAVSTDGSTLIGPDGSALVNLPAGVEVVYSTSSDGMQFTLTLIGRAFGSVATADSTSEYITVG